jgi:hypothetical protein
MWMTISAGRSFALGVWGEGAGISVGTVVGLRGVGREVNGEGMLMLCSREKDRVRAVADSVSRDGLVEDAVEVGFAVVDCGSAMGVVDDGREDMMSTPEA